MQTGVYFDNTIQKWVASAGGKIIARSRTSKEYVERKYLEAFPVGFTPKVKTEFVIEPAKKIPKPSVADRFAFISMYVRMLANKRYNTFVLTGSGGIGKTTEVMNTLIDMELRQIAPNEKEGHYKVMHGYSTARDLYCTLHDMNDKILILDDVDDAFKDPKAASILKAALDDKKDRLVCWGAQSWNDSYPKEFPYTGRIIFISNCSLKEFPQAIISRSEKVDLSLTVDEMVERIEYVFSVTDHDKQQKKDVLDFIKKYKDHATDLNVRSAVRLLTIRDAYPKEWEPLALYSFTS